MFKKIVSDVQQIKKIKPLILNITNDVTMDFIANGLLSVGASPVMSKSESELADLIQIASSVVINIGTLDETFMSRCHAACHIANQLQKPIVFDPVGVGATKYRTEQALSILNHYRIAIVRGNASEIAALAGCNVLTKGVDSSMTSDAAIQSAKTLAQQFQTVVAVSGVRDVIVDQKNIQQIARGHALMPMITGTGCLLTAITAAFHAVENDAWLAASNAHLFYSVAGEIAATQTNLPGTFRQYFLDALSLLPESKHYESETVCVDNCRH